MRRLAHLIGAAAIITSCASAQVPVSAPHSVPATDSSAQLWQEYQGIRSELNGGVLGPLFHSSAITEHIPFSMERLEHILFIHGELSRGSEADCTEQEIIGYVNQSARALLWANLANIEDLTQLSDVYRLANLVGRSEMPECMANTDPPIYRDGEQDRHWSKAREEYLIRRFMGLVQDMRPNPEEDAYSLQTAPYLMEMAVLAQQQSLSCKTAARFNDGVNSAARHYLSLTTSLLDRPVSHALGREGDAGDSSQDSILHANIVRLGIIVAMTESNYRCRGE